MNPLEQELRRVLARFLAEVLEAVERYAIEVVQHAFRQRLGSVALSRTHRASPISTGSTRTEPGPSNARPTYSQRLGRNELELRARVLDLLRHHPGLGTKDLAQALNLKTDQCRRFVDRMALDSHVRFDEISLRGLRRRAYYVVDVVDGLDGTEPILDVEPVRDAEAALALPMGAVA